LELRLSHPALPNRTVLRIHLCEKEVRIIVPAKNEKNSYGYLNRRMWRRGKTSSMSKLTTYLSTSSKRAIHNSRPEPPIFLEYF
jgi:hypothetical protein